MRILTRLNIGGPTLHAALLTNRLDPARFSTCLVTGTADPTEGDRSDLFQGSPARIVRIRTLRRSIRPWADAFTLFRLIRILWSERPDLVHTHMAKAGTLGRLSGLLYNRFGPGRQPQARALLVHTFHGHVLKGYFSPPATWLYTQIERWLAKRTDYLIAVSPTIRDQLLHLGIGRPEQWHVVPLGLDLSNFSELSFANGSFPLRCGLVGRLVPIKNPHLFLESVRQVAKNNGPHFIQAQVVGDGPLRQALETQTRALRLEEMVSFTGWQKDLTSTYQNLDLVCLTSWNEGTPVSLIEAMAAGRAVAATDVGGVRDLLGVPADGGSAQIPPGQFQVAERGLLVRAGDRDGLAAALEALAQRPELRRRLAESARTYVLRTFHHKRLLDEMTQLYQTWNSKIRKI